MVFVTDPEFGGVGKVSSCSDMRCILALCLELDNDTPCVVCGKRERPVPENDARWVLYGDLIFLISVLGVGNEVIFANRRVYKP